VTNVTYAACYFLILMNSWILGGCTHAILIIEERERLVAEKSGTPALTIKGIGRSGAK
jgi:hypothetical protein